MNVISRQVFRNRFNELIMSHELLLQRTLSKFQFFFSYFWEREKKIIYLILGNGSACEID